MHICIRILSVLYYYKSKLKRRVPLLSSSALSFYIEISKKISVVYEYIWEPAECFFSGNFLGNELETIMLSIYGQKNYFEHGESFLLRKNFFHFVVKLCLGYPHHPIFVLRTFMPKKPKEKYYRDISAHYILQIMYFFRIDSELLQVQIFCSFQKCHF